MSTPVENVFSMISEDVAQFCASYWWVIILVVLFVVWVYKTS